MTANRKLSRLAGFFAFCIQNGWLTENPAARVKRSTVGSLRRAGFPNLSFNGSLMQRTHTETGVEVATSITELTGFAPSCC